METQICYFLIFLVEAFILEQYASMLFQSRFCKKIEYGVLTVSYLVLFFLSVFRNLWLNALAVFLIHFVFFLSMYQIRWFSALFHSAITVTIMIISELIVFAFIATFAKNFYAEQNYFRNLSILAMLSKTLYFLILYLIAHGLEKKEEKSPESNRIALFLTGVPVLSAYVLLTLMEICQDTRIPLNLDWMISIASFFLLTINLLIFSINHYSQKKLLKFARVQLQLQKEYDTTEYYKMLLQQNENQSILIHDLKKHLQSLALLNEQGESERIASYIGSILNSSDFQKTLQRCDRELLNAILYRYDRQCQENHVSFQTDIRSHTVDFLTEEDLTSLFCNLLDNALEAAALVSDGFIELNLDNRQNTAFVVLTMVNSCLKDPFVKGSHQLPSHKSNPARHGFGMKSIQRIVARYQGDMEVYYDRETATFHTILTLKKPSGRYT